MRELFKVCILGLCLLSILERVSLPEIGEETFFSLKKNFKIERRNCKKQGKRED